MITDSEDKSMIAELERVIREEEAKPLSERDTDLIDECIREIAELKGVKAEFSDEEITAITGGLIDTAKQGQKRKRFIRLAAGIAAAIMIIGGITACSINPALINWIAEIVRMPFGSSVEQSKVTYYYQGVPTEYDNLEQFIESNNLNIYYPSILPSGAELDYIELLTKDDLNIIDFTYNLSTFHYCIQLNHSKSISKDDEIISTIESNGSRFDVCCIDKSYVSTSCLDGNTYIIETQSMDDMILVIGGLEKEPK